MPKGTHVKLSTIQFKTNELKIKSLIEIYGIFDLLVITF